MKFDCKRITLHEVDALWELHTAYKAEIGEPSPAKSDRNKLARAIESGAITFFGAFDGQKLVGCCSVTVGFSTFNYALIGLYEDFYIIPAYRKKGIARALVSFAYECSGVSSMTVGCADCDLGLYSALGFKTRLGNLLAYDGTSLKK